MKIIKSPSICTVIVAQFNRPNYTERSLLSLANNTELPIDIIVIDSGSEYENVIKLRNLVALIKSFKKNINITLVELPNNISIGYNRNFGQNMVRTRFVLHTDNDVLYKKQWLEEAMGIYESSGAELLGLWNHPLHYKIKDVNHDVHIRCTIPGNAWFSKSSLYDNWKWKEVPAIDYMKEIGEDMDLERRMSAAGVKVYSVNNNLMSHFGAIKSDNTIAADANLIPNYIL